MLNPACACCLRGSCPQADSTSFWFWAWGFKHISACLTIFLLNGCTTYFTSQYAHRHTLSQVDDVWFVFGAKRSFPRDVSTQIQALICPWFVRGADFLACAWTSGCIAQIRVWLVFRIYSLEGLYSMLKVVDNVMAGALIIGCSFALSKLKVCCFSK